MPLADTFYEKNAYGAQTRTRSYSTPGVVPGSQMHGCLRGVGAGIWAGPIAGKAGSHSGSLHAEPLWEPALPAMGCKAALTAIRYWRLSARPWA